MSNKNLYLLGIVAVIAIGTWMYLNLCSGCLNEANQEPRQLENSVVLKQSSKELTYPFALSDGSFALNIKDNFDFHPSNPTFLMPISKELKDGVETLRNYLIANDSSVVNIIGHFTPKEENNTPYPNLGLARAQSVKNHFIISGIPSGQIKVLGKLDEEMEKEGNVYLGAVSYALIQKKEEEKP
ncbi:hypothetical protein [Flagellimonas flava]|uniref:hypothetical protein n=1 Tax=Flagellimonas flava TaxID=570519 RepID=UPI003D64A7B1